MGTGDVMGTDQPLPGGARSLVGDEKLHCSQRECVVILDAAFEITVESDGADSDN